MEEWKPILETNRYEVSNEGGVRNAQTGRILNGTIDSQGRVQVCLTIDGKVKTRTVRRLVAEAFWGNDICAGKDTYNLDGDQTHNNIENICVKTRSEKMKGRYIPSNKKKIQCVETGEIFDSIAECADQFSVSRQAVSRAANNPACKIHTGFHFKIIK